MLDKWIVEFDKGLRTLFASAQSLRPHPDAALDEAELAAEEKKHALGLMRVNHCGEVCAQALYQGQALTARTPQAREALRQAAQEEVEHLAWTERRIRELGGRPSVFNPLWYTGSLAIGVAAGVLGDKWNLGFLEETEQQVGAHLDSHLSRLPAADVKSRAIVQQMRDDELKHADMAHDLGAAQLPAPVKGVMKLSAKVMTGASYRL
ncbi:MULTISPECIES: 2-polyprenyl-3-methyl-6-methoxy-1,4-benzoquinone monooxygenase [Chromobacterium]|uniref:3-demethoxyubiquinol 3-hydroxylase n=1 Tax=Chromobacterium haemolyticum TaxID=394935 RepID=A0A1W0CXE0_9NEIS|nr:MULTISPECIES: 2-polyprenyl-3-methyl-6-methoxy-1,4-benzoquinone monooxygenase [Chromobacterium]OQS39343.1 demethoxyubiquinone hydroxylase family protein [Chromobacterium haemolyticum]QOZ83288.1 2-polyprenyl-3-methyl-6-methoxy-1,4-benzoquinone monooxygenase [Chromobacterium sp. Rain0013]UGA38833.1 2-polyprenyl-3-methyl-6-methoxy-1,4-benzoquinone monooxygenase [Chromobacterium haemolyticum]WON83389.1 2-polyprenyl-3-methyl-6-methoxy-1,4-benzoquinone monooxygenase [Chromobacterium haemolyticum]